jgi:glycosyltransferase involved in cell wall biosynthesis
MPILAPASFIQTDVELLSERYEVRLIACRSPLGLIRTIRGALSATCVYCWFGSFWFLPVIVLARLLRKPVVIVCGGYDVANLPAIGYGNMRKGLSRWLGKLVFKAATVVIPFSKSAYREARQNAGIDPKKLHLIYLGIDGHVGAEGIEVAKAPIVLTVSNIDESTLTRKGLMVVAAVTHLLPSVQFVIVGRSDPAAFERLRAAAGPNTRFMGFVDDATLQQLMSTAKVIFQPSLHEGFGMSVAEAMLHGAIPVVSDRFSLPEVVGEAGFYGDPDSPATFAESVSRGLAAGREGSAAARQRIVREFSLDRRRAALLSLMDQICPLAAENRFNSETSTPPAP